MYLKKEIFVTTKKNSLNIFLLSGSFLYLVLTLNFEIKKFLLITFVVFSFIFFTFRKEKSFFFHVIFQTLINIFAYILYQKIDLAIITLSFVLLNIYLFKSDKFASELDYRGYPNFLKSSWTGIFMLFILTVLTQNVYLNFETIDWDINSYLVSSLDIGRGNLPYEGQWEDKQPLLYYIYYSLIVLSGKNLVIFKILSDIPILLLAILVYKISNLSNNENKENILLGPVIFVSLMSVPWASAGYSEIYSLLFLATSYYLVVSNFQKGLKIFIAGCFFSLSTLVNIGTAIFLICFVFMIYSSTKKTKNFLFFMIGSVLPHIATYLVYLSYGLQDIYLTTLIKIPFGYSVSSSLNFGLFNSFLKSFYNSSIILYLILIFLFVEKLIDLIYVISNRNNNSWIKTSNYIFIGTSLLFFFLAAKGFNHHLIFVLFFTSIVVDTKSEIKSVLVKSFLMFIFIISFSLTNLSTSLNNIYNITSLEESYPLKQLSLEIDKQFKSEYTILALDHTLILYYLDIPNFSYVIHPTNHFESWITSNLIELGIIKEANIISMIDKEPDVILCSNVSIINGIPTRDNELKGYNCEISDFNDKYKKLDTTFYKNNININYYYDPYKDIGVYIKTEELKK